MITIESPPSSAKANMAKDEELLAHLGEQPILHFYAWEKPAATYGYFIRPEEYFLEGHGLDIARRPTGGGVIFHHCDLAFSILIPASHPLFSTHTLTNYQTINRIVSKAVSTYKGEEVTLLSTDMPCDNTCMSSFCMAKPTIYDLFWKGKKVGGAAQRKTKKGFLHQGSLSLSLPTPPFLSKILKNGEAIARQMGEESLSLLQPSVCFIEERERMKNTLGSFFVATTVSIEM